ncbi:hypothetical protein LAZ67_21002741 [Cordylochernes scorpioides]|uniref:Cytochrome P450 n=1 Tax=Cordylochernes scorpioides TaxID=51811 RepID=A0ABY6LPQ1_9ARAC|nr:hypothetical protein LAZ67_21002741 [Cordylochernes scorpioides]
MYCPGLSETEILANAILFFFTGYETTASTLSHCAYMLALNPECQDRLAEEVFAALDDPLFKSSGPTRSDVQKASLDYDTVKKLPYLNAVISETLRMYSPASRTDRIAKENYVLGETGIVVPKGVLVQFPIHTIHHDAEYFPDPQRYDPERFLPENRDKILPFTYIPFGAGPRNCIAERFALLEMKLCLAKVIHRFRFTQVPETQVISLTQNVTDPSYSGIQHPFIFFILD